MKLRLIAVLKASLFLKSLAFSTLPSTFHRFPISPKSQSSSPCTSSSTSLAGKYVNRNNGEERCDRTDINQFLTQRTVQSFMHLLKQFRDPHSGRWVEDFIGAKNLLEFHGTGGICMSTFPNWDSVFSELIEQPPAVVIVEMKSNNAARGLSKNNPYREKEDHVVEMEIDIDPPSLANRMLAVRASIASEFAADLDLIIAATKEILASYNEKCIKAREDEKEKKNKDGEDDDGCAIKPVQEGSMSGDFNFGQRTTQMFERTAVYMLNNHPNFNNPESTLLRSTSFDLLFLLSTQESIHRVLKSYKEAGEEKDVSFAWLLEFYNSSLDKYFDGNQSFGRADDFLDDLLLTPPSLKTIDNNIGFIDPLSIAEDIIKVREHVAAEWKNLMTLVPHDQERIRQAVFVKQMAKWGNPVADTVSETNKEDSEKENEELAEGKETGELFAEVEESTEETSENGLISEEIEESDGESRESVVISATTKESKKKSKEDGALKDEGCTIENDEICAEIEDSDELIEEIENEIFVEEFPVFAKIAERMFGLTQEKEKETIEIIGEFE